MNLDENLDEKEKKDDEQNNDDKQNKPDNQEKQTKEKEEEARRDVRRRFGCLILRMKQRILTKLRKT